MGMIGAGNEAGVTLKLSRDSSVRGVSFDGGEVIVGVEGETLSGRLHGLPTSALDVQSTDAAHRGLRNRPAWKACCHILMREWDVRNVRARRGSLSPVVLCSMLGALTLEMPLSGGFLWSYSQERSGLHHAAASCERS